MESFVHLRKAVPPSVTPTSTGGRRTRARRNTGRTENIYRRHDPTAYRASGPLRPVDVMTSELKPGDATDAAGTPPAVLERRLPDLLSRRGEAMPFYTRRRRRSVVLRARRRRPAGNRVRAAALPGG
jgi:homogentisate 1,2-dioxygenase